MLLAIACTLVVLSVSHAVRVCPENFEYLYDPEGHCSISKNDRDLPELVTQYGYKFETYEITTPDKYILMLNHLPVENPKGSILLLHPATGTATVWLDKGNTSLAYALHNAGYDVWMINFRGCYYSKKHVYLNPNKEKYWLFSYHEMGIYDIPTAIDFIRKNTNTGKLACIGHSLGASAAVVYTAMLPQHAVDNVNIFILMGPGVYFKHFKSPIKYLAGLFPLYCKYAFAFGSYEFGPRTPLYKALFGICRVYPGMEYCTEFFQYFIVGVNHANVKPDYVPVMFSQFPGGLNLRVFQHFMQNLFDGRFAQFDYGEDNEKHYNSTLSPEYPLKDIRSRLLMMAGTHDNIAAIPDVQAFQDVLQSAARVDPILIQDGYQHADYLYANTIQTQVNEPIINTCNAIYAV